ncbi:hypothetical protein [Paraburkholderia sediminicola]|uniref:hypothetical protein n=1 Tax=Paraburkholderia sediminicola TaxID=458836 RepID=UPI0038BA762A
MKKTIVVALLAAIGLSACSGEPSDMDKLDAGIKEANNAVQIAQNMCRGDRDTDSKLCAQLDYAQARIDDVQGYFDKVKNK